MKIKIILLALFIVFLFSSSLLFAQSTEQITITTYYPSPNGVYNQLAANKFVVDIANMSEYGDMQTGDALIGRALLVGATGEYPNMQAGDVHFGRSFIVGDANNGYAYGTATPNPGDTLIEGQVGIGTPTPDTDYVQVTIVSPDIDRAALWWKVNDQYIGSLGQTENGDAIIAAHFLGNRHMIFKTADGSRMIITGDPGVTGSNNAGDVGIGMDIAGGAMPESRLHVVSEDGDVMRFSYSGFPGLVDRDGLSIVGNGTTGTAFSVQNIGGIAAGLQMIDDTGNGKAHVAWNMQDNNLQIASDTDIQFYSNASGGTANVGFSLPWPDTPRSDPPNGVPYGNLDVNDVWLRGATPPRWASEGSPATVHIEQGPLTPSDTWSQACCPPGYVVSGCSIVRTTNTGVPKDTGDEEDRGIIGAYPTMPVMSDSCCNGRTDGTYHILFTHCIMGTYE